MATFIDGQLLVMGILDTKKAGTPSWAYLQEKLDDLILLTHTYLMRTRWIGEVRMTKKKMKSLFDQLDFTHTPIFSDIEQEKSMLVYTDASLNNNQAGIAYFYKINNDHVEYVLTYAKLRNEAFDSLDIHLSEMEAILQAIEVAKYKKVTEIIFLTDSQKAIKSFAKKLEKYDGKDIKRYKEKTKEFAKSCPTALLYIPAHSGILGNEQCDVSAKKGRLLNELSPAFSVNLIGAQKPVKIITGVDKQGELIIEEVKRYPSKKEALKLIETALKTID